jgi:hypothetical protein
MQAREEVWIRNAPLPTALSCQAILSLYGRVGSPASVLAEVR